MRNPIVLLLVFVLSALLPFACSDDEPMPPKECPLTDCSAMGLDCGRITDANGQCFTCGQCRAPATCGGSGRANVCGCSARTQCEAGECGAADDGCGGVLECGGCAPPAECGAAGQPNRCAIVAAPGEACDGILTFCGSGYRCCAMSGRPSVCVEPFGGTMCPPSGVDLTLDQASLRRSLRLLERDVPGPMCPLFEGCQLTPGLRRVLRFEPTVVNTGTQAFALGSYNADNPLLVPDVCSSGFQMKLLTWRLLGSGEVVASGALRRTCVDDYNAHNPDPSPRLFDCSASNAGISAGWASLLRPESGCPNVDVTEVPAGAYVLELTVNGDRLIREFDYSNNVATATVTLP